MAWRVGCEPPDWGRRPSKASLCSTASKAGDPLPWEPFLFCPQQLKAIWGPCPRDRLVQCGFSSFQGGFELRVGTCWGYHLRFFFLFFPTRLKSRSPEKSRTRFFSEPLHFSLHLPFWIILASWLILLVREVGNEKWNEPFGDSLKGNHQLDGL